jgi:hypothetical protein
MFPPRRRVSKRKGSGLSGILPAPPINPADEI